MDSSELLADTENETRASDSFDLSHMLKPSEIHEEEESINEPISDILNKSLSSSVPVLASHNAADNVTSGDELKNAALLHTSYSLPELQNSGDEDEKSEEASRRRIDPYKLKPRLMVALFDYDPAVSSPNVDSEVLFLSCDSIISYYLLFVITAINFVFI